MADKTVTIKNATDQQLDDLLIRLRKEGELQKLIASIKRNGLSTYLPYDNPQISTEEPIESLYHQETVDEFLTHYGVLGMHWGHRKPKPVLVSHPDHLKKEEIIKNKLHQLSNTEIQTVNSRLQLERSYKDLNKRDVSIGEKWVKDVLIGAATVTAGVYAKKYMGKGAELLIKKLMEPSAIAKRLAQISTL